MELTSKTRKQFVFVDTHHCYYMSTVVWIFYNGYYILRAFQFPEDLLLLFFNFAKFKAHEIKYQLGINKLIFACMKLLKSLNVSLFAFHS